jgi:hypothetical protein
MPLETETSRAESLGIGVRSVRDSQEAPKLPVTDRTHEVTTSENECAGASLRCSQAATDGWRQVVPEARVHPEASSSDGTGAGLLTMLERLDRDGDRTNPCGAEVYATSSLASSAGRITRVALEASAAIDGGRRREYVDSATNGG